MKRRGADIAPRKGSLRAGEGKPGAYFSKPSPHRWAVALAMLVEGRRVKDIAEHLGVEPHTVRNWMHHPDCKLELQEALAESLDDAKRTLEAGSTRAARQLVKLARTGGREDMARVKAAAEVLDRSGLTKRQRVEVQLGGQLSGLSDEQLMEIVQKAQRAPPPSE